MEKKLNILVPVDFSPVSFKAIEFLHFLLQTTPVNTHLVHVLEVNTGDWGGSAEASETLDKQKFKAEEQKALQRFEELRKQADFDFTSEIVYGGLTTAIARYAATHQIDLVVMGTEGADGWLEKISGSEAQHVVRYTDVPVITVHQFASITPIHNILWVADFGAEKQPEQTIVTIKNLQRLFNAKLHLLQIIGKEDEQQSQKIQLNMRRFADTYDLQNYELHLHHNYKVPAGVRNFNEASEMDLVLIGTHARKGINHLFYGSIAETLVNHCIRPLLTYHLK
ncbi:universal stress protein [Pontibacter fetidus]|uniref:Universal stress protein n=1 Tax=Pontibacter fetidus TaxID=2700082 RepID=A0A6B2H5S0_9BACT|nr:universal stress protein [Pontibacter fetidus]NDK55647.1 universal stress protein [Pontibacter fetidus]